MSNHTPGPWESPETDGHWRVICSRINGKRRTIAQVCKGDRRDANARLIAAAPELLVALELLTADMKFLYRDQDGDMDHDGIQFAEAAIRKAKGEE